jgi:FlaA1/EpsC-like NDP-sugar epimerase
MATSKVKETKAKTAAKSKASAAKTKVKASAVKTTVKASASKAKASAVKAATATKATVAKVKAKVQSTVQSAAKVSHYPVLIIGGGAAGVSVANTLRRKSTLLEIALIEPSEQHYYQPGFTIIGGGAYSLKKATKQEADLLHPSIIWVKDFAETFEPGGRCISVESS